jgi:cell wall-associated NlpC family hydrolase
MVNRASILRGASTGALLAACLLSMPTTARAQEGVRISPPYTPVANTQAPAATATALRDSVVSRARAQLGKRYRYGGETPKHGFDCSGLVSYVMSGLSLIVPRTAAAQALVGIEIVRDTARLLPGDLVTFGRGKTITHIGIYIGNGRFIQASSRAHKVIEVDLLRAPAPGIRPWLGVRRLVSPDTTAAPTDGPAPNGSTR